MLESEITKKPSNPFYFDNSAARNMAPLITISARSARADLNVITALEVSSITSENPFGLNAVDFEYGVAQPVRPITIRPADRYKKYLFFKIDI